MGIVYEAHQVSLDRRVALKALPFAAVLDQKQIVRFENEARAAAQLHHPNIVPVFSVGCERGVHYYAMQYIEGASLDRTLADVRGDSTRDAEGMRSTDPDETTRRTDGDPARHSTLRALTTIESGRGRDYYRAVCHLGIQAAEALHHAHECGIVHRDVKPSNLLLDDDGQALGDRLRPGPLRQADAGLTADRRRARHAPLHEPRAGGRKVAPGRSANRRLFARHHALRSGRACSRPSMGRSEPDLLRRITQEEPRLPRRIRPSIPADLETIVHKAISKTPEQRYHTAQELADDLRRFLDGKPTLARRPTWMDRAGKWTRRHIRFVAAAACIAVCAAGGLAVSTLTIAGAHAKTKAALGQSETNHARAEKHFRQARDIVDRFGVRLAEQLAQVPGTESVRAELLQDTLRYYQAFTEYAASDPDLQADLALTHFKTGKIHEQIGNREQALAEYRMALAGFQQFGEGTVAGRDCRAEMALCHNDMGLLYGTAGKVNEARTALNTALNLQQELLDQAPRDVKALNDKALTLGNLGLIEHRAGNTAGAEEHFLAAARIQEQLAHDDPRQLDYQSALAVTFNNLSFVYAGVDVARAEEACRKALAIQERLTAAQPASVEYLSDLGLSYNNLGMLQNDRGHGAEAIQAYHQAVEIRRRLLRKAPLLVRFRSDLAVSCNNLGQVYSDLGNQQEALEPLGEAIELFQQLVADYPEELNLRSCLGGAQNNLAMAHQRLGNLEEAVKASRAAIEHQRFAFDHASSVARFRQFLSNHYGNLGDLLRQQGRLQEAVEVALARRELWPDDPERLFAVAVELANTAIGGTDADHQWTEAALATLGQAVEAGFCDSDRIRGEPAFKLVQDHPDFVAILSRIQSERDVTPQKENAQSTEKRQQPQATS